VGASRRLTTLWASSARYRDCFTFFILFIYNTSGMINCSAALDSCLTKGTADGTCDLVRSFIIDEYIHTSAADQSGRAV
jgi:hypothetical protein